MSDPGAVANDGFYGANDNDPKEEGLVQLCWPKSKHCYRRCRSLKLIKDDPLRDQMRKIIMTKSLFFPDEILWGVLNRESNALTSWTINLKDWCISTISSYLMLLCWWNKVLYNTWGMGYKKGPYFGCWKKAVASYLSFLWQFCPYLLYFSVIDRTPPPPIWGCWQRNGPQFRQEGSPVTPFTVLWGQISWPEQKSSPLLQMTPYVFAWCQNADSALNRIYGQQHQSQERRSTSLCNTFHL